MPFPKYDSVAHNNLFRDAARSEVFYWCPLYHDVRAQMIWGRCYKCHYPVGITDEALERTFWRLAADVRGVPKAQCDNCGTKLLVPDAYATRELIMFANVGSVDALKEEQITLARVKMDEVLRVRRSDGAPTVGENLLCDIWDALTENYGDLPPAMQMWLEEHDGIEEHVLQIRERQKRAAEDSWAKRQLARYQPGDFGTRGLTGL